MNSLRFRLWLLWTLTLLASSGVALLLLALSRSSDTAHLARAEAVAARACGLIGDRFAFYTGGATCDASDTGQAGAALRPVVVAALARQTGVGGGIWSSTTGLVTQAFPTGTAADPPRAVLAAVRQASAEAAEGEQPVVRRVATEGPGLALAACPLPGAPDGLTAWAVAGVGEAVGTDTLRGGLALLGGLVVLIAAGVLWLTATWGRHLGRLEAALRCHDIEDLPRLPRTGERELDRIVVALNAAGERTARARARAAELAGRVASAERLAALGRVAAGVAHEIRNPMAAMRLRAENALAGDPARLRPALEASLHAIARVDRLLAEMLAMTQRRAPNPAPVDVGAFLRERAAAQAERAEAEGIAVAVEAGDRIVAPFDAELAGRAVDNLLLNALQHAGRGGRVAMTARREGPWLRLAVADTGPGVTAAIRPVLFEPFATGRPDGTGLGLAIAREMAEAHGGQLRLAEGDGPGATFELDLPLGGEAGQ